MFFGFALRGFQGSIVSKVTQTSKQLDDFLILKCPSCAKPPVATINSSSVWKRENQTNLMSEQKTNQREKSVLKISQYKSLWKSIKLKSKQVDAARKSLCWIQFSQYSKQSPKPLQSSSQQISLGEVN